MKLDDTGCFRVASASNDPTEGSASLPLANGARPGTEAGPSPSALTGWLPAEDFADELLPSGPDEAGTAPGREHSKAAGSGAAPASIAAVPPGEYEPFEPATTQEDALAKITRPGNVDVLSAEAAFGWASVSASGGFSYVYAVLDTEVIGSAMARIQRPDLEKARAEGTLDAYAFAIVFSRPVPADRIEAIQIRVAGAAEPLPRSKTLRLDRSPRLRVFVFGSPRSGTSEMGGTLASVLQLPWLGEGHAAPLFAAAADALQGDAASTNGLVRFMARERYRRIAVDAAREAYYFMHGSASFLDKTPGAPMIRVAPFVHECFPDAYFIFLWRNPVANVLSRMVKFGGNFEGNCRDWSAAMTAWTQVRARLPHYLEIRQEDMLADPAGVGTAIATYLGLPETAAPIGASLATGTRERTGAGVGKSLLGETGWTSEQIGLFTRICEPAYQAFTAGT